MTQTQLTKELDKTDAFLLACNQLLSKMGDDSTALSLTVAAFNKQNAVLESKLSAGRLKIYTWDYTGGDMTRGMQVMEKLRGVQESFSALGNLLNAMYGEQSPDGSVKYALAHDFATALRQAEPRFKVADVVRDMLVSRAVQQAADAGDLEKLQKLLNPE
eukprot:4909922-Alexandrium_andersonii.AAC.1